MEDRQTTAGIHDAESREFDAGWRLEEIRVPASPRPAEQGRAHIILRLPVLTLDLLGKKTLVYIVVVV